MAKNIKKSTAVKAINVDGFPYQDGNGDWFTGTCSDTNWATKETCELAGVCSDTALIGKSDCLCGSGGIWDGSACSTGSATGNTFTVHTWTANAYVPQWHELERIPHCSGNVSGTVYLTAQDCTDAGVCSDTQYTTAGTCTGASETWTDSEYVWVDPAYPKPVKHLQNVPTAETDACVIGDMAVEAGFLFVCVADNTWKKVALSAI